MSEEWKDSVQVGMEQRIQESEYDAQIFTLVKMPRNADSQELSRREIQTLLATERLL